MLSAVFINIQIDAHCEVSIGACCPQILLLYDVIVNWHGMCADAYVPGNSKVLL